MTVATLAEVLQPALSDGYAVAGLVCLGWEDMRAFAHAAQDEGASVILQAGPGCRNHTPLPVLASMMRHLAESVDVPVVIHLDHGYSADDCRIAIDCGFSSVMFDGSKLPLGDNIEQTARIAEMAHRAGVSVEGEIGFVGYAGGVESKGTVPDEAARFARETGVDAMAISIGNVHLQTESAGDLDRARLQEIEAVTDVPLVIHGGSGVSHKERGDLARHSKICKYNIGTELRQTFGLALRDTLAANPAMFDRLEILKSTEEPLRLAARRVINGLRPDRIH